MASFIGVVDVTIMTVMVCAILIIGMIWLGSVASVVVLGVMYGLFSGLSRSALSSTCAGDTEPSIDIAMMPAMLGLTSDPAELGYVLLPVTIPSVDAFACRIRLGVGFAITGASTLVLQVFLPHDRFDVIKASVA